MIVTKNENRRKAFSLPRNILMSWLNRKIVFDLSELPADTKIVYVAHEWQSDSFAIVVESEEFDPVPIGQAIGMIYVPAMYVQNGWHPIEQAERIHERELLGFRRTEHIWEKMYWSDDKEAFIDSVTGCRTDYSHFKQIELPVLN